MKKMVSGIVVALFICLSVIASSQPAHADEGKLVGTISKIEMAADNKSATVVLKDIKTEEEVVVVVTDELTIDKMKDKRIVEGDEIRCKYEKEDGKNTSKLFKKTAGC